MSLALRPLTLIALVVVLVVGGCTSAATTDTRAAVEAVSASTAVELLDSRTVIDVRTPEEYAAGHVAGALNIDVEGADFGARIAELDPAAAYLVYCRSGRRSALAAQAMADAGFTDIVDAGGLGDLAAAGAPIE